MIIKVNKDGYVAKPKIIVTGQMTGTDLCKDGPGVVTFTGTGGQKPYTFYYTIDGGETQSVSTTGENSSVTVNVNTDTVTTITYVLLSIEDANSIRGSILGSNTLAINIFALPTASISVTTTVNQGDPEPDVTFTATGTPGNQSRFTYKHSSTGSTNLYVTTALGSAIAKVAQPTGTPGAFTYTLISVMNLDTGCFQSQTGIVVITVN